MRKKKRISIFFILIFIIFNFLLFSKVCQIQNLSNLVKEILGINCCGPRSRTFFNFCVPEPVYYFSSVPSVLSYDHPRFPPLPSTLFTSHFSPALKLTSKTLKIKKNDLTVNCFMQFTVMVAILTVTKTKLIPCFYFRSVISKMREIHSSMRYNTHRMMARSVFISVITAE